MTAKYLLPIKGNRGGVDPTEALPRACKLTWAFRWGVQRRAPSLAQAARPRAQPVCARPSREPPAALGHRFPRALPWALSTRSPQPHGSCLPQSPLCMPWPLLPQHSTGNLTGEEESVVQGLALFASEEEQQQPLSTPWLPREFSTWPVLQHPPGFSEQST